MIVDGIVAVWFQILEIENVEDHESSDDGKERYENRNQHEVETATGSPRTVVGLAVGRQSRSSGFGKFAKPEVSQDYGEY